MSNQNFSTEHLAHNLKEFDNYLASQDDMTQAEKNFASMIAHVAVIWPDEQTIAHGLAQQAESSAEYNTWHQETYGTTEGAEIHPAATRPGVVWGNWES